MRTLIAPIPYWKEWASESREESEAKSFWDAFFTVFGIKRRTVASFEEPVKKLSGTWGFIDLFWKGTLLAEHKSRGKPLDKAHAQAMEYIQGLKNANRDPEIPQYVVVSDFAKIALHDLDEGTSVDCSARSGIAGYEHSTRLAMPTDFRCFGRVFAGTVRRVRRRRSDDRT